MDSKGHSSPLSGNTASPNGQQSGGNHATKTLDLLTELIVDEIEPLDVENIELAETDLSLPESVQTALNTDDPTTSPLNRLTQVLLNHAEEAQNQFTESHMSDESAQEAGSFWKQIMDAKPKAILQLKTLLHCIIASAAPDSSVVSDEPIQISRALQSIQAFFALVSIPGSSVYRICSNYTARVVLIRLKFLLKNSCGTEQTEREAIKTIASARCVAQALSLSGCGIPHESIGELIDTISSTIPYCDLSDTSEETLYAALRSFFISLLKSDAKFEGDLSRKTCKQLKYYIHFSAGSSNQTTNEVANKLALDCLSTALEDEQNAVYGMQAALALCHHLAVDDQKKADDRSTAMRTIQNVLPLLSEDKRLSFLSLISKLLRSSRCKQRHFAVQLGGQLLTKQWMWELLAQETEERNCKPPGSPQAETSEENQEDDKEPVSKFLRVLMRRCLDRSASVRAASILCAKNILSMAIESSGNMVDKVMEILNEGCGKDVGTGNGEISMNNTLSSRHESNVPLLTVLLRRSDDDNAHVRKASVETLEIFCLAQVHQFNKEHMIQDLAGDYTIQVLASKCSDGSTIVRRAAIITLSNLMMHENSTSVREAWLAGVLPLVCDPEKTVQEKALQLVSWILIEPIYTEATDKEESKFWNVFRPIYESQPLRNSFSAALEKLWQHETTNKSCSLGKVLDLTLSIATCGDEEEALVSERTTGAWIFIAMTLASTTSKNKISRRLKDIYELVATNWATFHSTLRQQAEQRQENDKAWLLLSSMVNTLRNCAKLLKKGMQVETDILDTLATIKTLSNSSADFIRQSIEALLDESLIGGDVADHANKLVTYAEKHLEKITMEGESSGTRTAAVPQLYILGELALVRAISSENQDNMSCQSPFSSKLLTLIEGLTTPHAHFGRKQLSSEIRAHAFLCLGKLCLTDGELARKYLKVFITELMSPWRDSSSGEQEAGVEIRNNLLLTLCDLCMRYPGLVENYSDQLGASLRDPHPLIRRQSVATLSTLLQQDFLKWRARLLHRFFVCLIDEDELVRRAAHQALTGPMLVKHPNLLSAHFVEAVFVLSGSEQHPSFQTVSTKYGAPESRNEIAAQLPPLSIEGPDAVELRLEVYRSLLRAMKPEQKLTVQAKLVTDILAPIAEEAVPVNEEEDQSAVGTRELITEVLRILQLREIRVNSSQSTPANQGQEDEETEAIEAGLVAAKQRVLHRMAQKHTLERTVPVLMKLKSLLASIQSPILKMLMNYLRSLWMTYKESFSDAVASDRRLAAELEYDVKQWKNEMRRPRERNDTEDTNVEENTQPTPNNKRTEASAAPKSCSLMTLTL